MIEIPESEYEFGYSTSSGPGGQHVNKVETRVTLRFDVEASLSLTPWQKRQIHEKLATRINKDGILRVVSQRHRSRLANQRAAVLRFHDLLEEALRRQPPRKKTRVPAGVRRRRVDSKRKRGNRKRERSGKWDD